MVMNNARIAVYSVVNDYVLLSARYISFYALQDFISSYFPP